MAVNLIRNTKMVLVKGATAVDQVTGELLGSPVLDDTTAYEIQILDGFSFSQNTTSDTITLNESGDTPIRGQRTFNTALDPVEFSFSTYIRPTKATVAGQDVGAEEGVLWGAFASDDGTGWSDGVDGSSDASVNWTNSDAHQLEKFVLLMAVDNDTYVLENCVLDQATIDFGIDAIATIQWTGRAAKLTGTGSALSIGTPTAGVSALSGSYSGSCKAKDVNAHYLANKLSSVTLQKGGAGTTYNIPLTGGSITISNNVTYLTPANLGVVNKPITYFTGTRAISGSLNAYLKTGAGNTGPLLSQLLVDADATTEPNWDLNIYLGGSSTAPLRVHFDMPHTSVQIPTINSESVISTTVNFTAQGWNSGAAEFDVEQTNELVVTYYSPNA